ncbi:MAG TPA: lipase family protein, partial [Dongiaceae bacterium]|nr:lipase family protein [Dongiaceae bacterium]
STVATIMSRLGLEDNACVRITRTVDAMLIFSTAYLVQSRCGRVVILSYRGTESANLGNWLGDADVGSASVMLDGDPLAVHSGFYRNLRATQVEVFTELERAIRGRSLANPEQSVEHPMEALYVTGHSLGGAMAAIFAIVLAGSAEHRAIAGKLRAVYTYGQPACIGAPLPPSARAMGEKLFRHVRIRDPIPVLPPVAWGRFPHAGHEFRFENDEWTESEEPVQQLKGIREIPISLMAFFATGKRRNRARYSLLEHAPHFYIDELRPEGQITEFGDRG